MSDSEDRMVSAEALRIMSSLIRSTPPSGAPEIGDELLIEVACGIATEADQATVFQLATQSPAVRLRFTGLRRRALELAKNPSLADPTSSDDQHLLACLEKKVASQLRPKLAASWAQFVERNRLTAAALTGAICQSMAIAQGRFQFAYSREESPATRLLANGVTAHLAIRPLGDDLQVEVSFPDDSSLGKLLVLSLEDPSGGQLHLHSAPIEGPVWVAVLKEFLAIAGTEADQIPLSVFSLSLAGEAKLAIPKRLMFVAIPPDLQRDDSSTVIVELAAPAAILDGTLVLEFELPRGFVRTYADADLEVSIGFGSSRIQIASYPLADWPTGVRRLEISLADVTDGRIEFGSLIQLSIATSA